MDGPASSAGVFYFSSKKYYAILLDMINLLPSIIRSLIPYSILQSGIFIICLLCFPQTSDSSAIEVQNQKPAKKVALLPIVSSGAFTPDKAKSVWDVMRNTIVKTSQYEVLDRDTMHALLGGKRCALKPLDKDCFIETGKILKVDNLIVGKIVPFNNLFYLSFVRISSSTGKVENIADDECPEENILDFSEHIASRLTRKFYFLEPDPKPDWRNNDEVNDLFRIYLSAPDKDSWQKPQMVIDNMPVHSGGVIAEIGAGTGYFTPWLSKKVGQDGIVFATDVDQKMLDRIDRKIKSGHLQNVKTLLVPFEDPSLPKSSIDLVFLCDITTDMFSDQNKAVPYLKKLKDVLRNDGKIVILDYNVPKGVFPEFAPKEYSDIKSDGGVLPHIDTRMVVISHFKDSAIKIGIPFAFRVEKDDVIGLMSKAGFKLDSEKYFLPYQYFLIFSKI